MTVLISHSQPVLHSPLMSGNSTTCPLKVDIPAEAHSQLLRAAHAEEVTIFWADFGDMMNEMMQKMNDVVDGDGDGDSDKIPVKLVWLPSHFTRDYHAIT